MNFVERATAEFAERMRGAAGVEAQVRQRAWADFEARGLPARRHAAWRYSSVNSLTSGEWTARVATGVPERARVLRDFWRGRFDVLMLVDGAVRRDESVISTELEGFLSPASLSDATLGDGFVSLSTATARLGFALRVPRNAVLARPVLMIATAAGDQTFAPVLNQIHLNEGAALDLALVHIGDGAYLRSDVTRVTLDRAARLNWVRAQQEDRRARHFSETTVRLDRDAALNVTQLNAGAAFTRASMTVDIDGEGAEATMLGLTFGRDLQHVDQRVEVNHRAAHTASAQLFKGVLRDRARGILNGKIFIAPGAQKVASSQLNHNLLLTPGAEANTHPELEIYADDVKANHGASIGRLDEDRIFYLMSRGLPRDFARRLLAQAFVADVLMKIPSPTLRDFAEARVRDFLPEYL